MRARSVGLRRRRIAARVVRRRMLELRRLRRAGAAVDVTDVAMVERALRLARRAAAEGEVPVAAVVYRDGVVLAEAYNRREGSPDPLGHAELLALREAGRHLGQWRLVGCSIAVTLEPCTMCAGALVNARLAKLVYGAADVKSGACESLYAIPEDIRLNHRLEVVRGVHARASAALLGRFFRARRGRVREIGLL